MATYKVIQDIEAEDKLLGPLSFRQFVYFLIAAFLGFVNFTVATKGAAFLTVFLLPPMLFCLFFAWPWSPDQPTEVWALARIRYFFKPRKRLWNQSGVKEFVTVTAPKRIEKAYTDGLSQDQVRSRLEALSLTIDSRGWAIKNGAKFTPQVSDRLIGFGTGPGEVTDIHAADDILDERNNSTAQQMSQLVAVANAARRQEVIQKMNAAPAAAPAATQPEWFQRQQAPSQPIVVTPSPDPATSLPSVPVVSAPETSSPVAAAKPMMPPNPFMPFPMGPPPAAAAETVAEPIKTPTNPAIISLAHDNDKDVATLAREAKRAKGEDTTEGEVVVPLR